MINKRYLSIFIFMIFLLNLFSPVSTASENNLNNENSLGDLSNDDGENNERFIDKLAEKIIGIPFFLENIMQKQNIRLFFKWYIYRLQEPPIFVSRPNSINIEYLNNSFIEIGMEDKEGNWRTNFQGWPFADEEYFEFKLDLPEEIPNGSIKYRFLPNEYLYPKKGKETKVILNIETYFPNDFQIPDQFILRVNITRYQIINNLLKNAYNSPWVSGSPVSKIIFLLGGWLAWVQFLQIQGVGEQNVYLDIVVKENRSHLLEIIPNTKKYTLAPDTIDEIPIRIRNLGSHKDTFNFKIFTENNEDIMLSAPNSVSLEPFEEKTVYISLASPRIFNNPGTLHDIKIQAHSVYDPDIKFNNTVAVITEGIYVSEGFLYSSIPTLIFILVVLYLFYIKRKRKMEKLFAKPKKPWNIPEEEKHLEELKKKNKDKYEKELQMMEDEYKSALLWYRSYLDFVLTEKRRKKLKERESKVKKEKAKPKNKREKKKSEKKSVSKIGTIFTELFKKEEKPKAKKEKPKKQKEIPEKKPEKPKPIKEVKLKKPSPTQSRKQKIIEKIKREQEKQKLKLGD